MDSFLGTAAKDQDSDRIFCYVILGRIVLLRRRCLLLQTEYTRGLSVYYILGAHWHDLNTNEQSMCGGDTSFHQVTFDNCFYLWFRALD